MSLTVFSDKKRPLVGVRKWFKDPKYTLNYACGPLLEMESGEFRKRGYDLVLSHFEEHERIRLMEKDVKPVFETIDERKYLKQQRPVQISKNPATKEVRVSPFRFRSYTLSGLVSYDIEFCRILPIGFTQSQFWEAFDAAFAETA